MHNLEKSLVVGRSEARITFKIEKKACLRRSTSNDQQHRSIILLRFLYYRAIGEVLSDFEHT